jgi:hypothetical protein
MGYPGYYGCQVGEENNHIALFIDPNSVAGGAFSGNINELMLPNRVDFKQANAVTSPTNWISSPTLSLNNGNVGIGNGSPTFKLDVLGDVMFGSGNRFETATNVFKGPAGQNGIMLRSAISTAANPSYTNVDDANTGMFLPGSDVVGFTTAGSERMRITSSGNVGIGTTSPQTKLAIGSSQGSGIDFLYDATNNYKHQIKNYWNSSADSRMDFNIGRTSGVTPVTVMSVGYNNNVGIGTISPTFKLHVNSTDASDNVAYIHHNNAAQSSGDVLKVRSDAGDNAGSALLNVANNTGTALYVRGDRNVGIGTTSPAQNFVVADATNGNGIELVPDRKSVV